MSEFVKRCHNHDVELSCKVAKAWKEDCAMVGYIRVDFFKEAIVEATPLSLEGQFYDRVVRIK